MNSQKALSLSLSLYIYMASCNDNFPLITDDDNPQAHPPHQQSFASHHIATGNAGTSSKKVPGSGESDADSGNAQYYPQPHDVNLFSPEEESDPNKPGNGALTSKRNPYYYKKLKPGGGSVGGGGSESGGEYRVDYRKDREEWSDSSIACLLDVYTEKFTQLNRGNLRGRDWEAVADIVSERCDKQKARKTVEQCKNKIDNLKKRYKVELQRMSVNGLTVSHWHWFKKIEAIIGNLPAVKSVSDEDRSGGGGGSGYMLRQSKRNGSSTAAFANNMKSKSLSNPKWRRVVFKISGAALAGNGQSVDPKVAMQIAREVATACRLGVEVAIVVGGRNFFCGDSWVSSTGLDRPIAYQIGMMATVMNSILLQSALEKLGVQTRVQSAFAMPEVAEPYSKQRAIRHLEKGRVVIFGGIGAGTGNPLFSTDTAAALRASEINADAVLKGTNVNGAYDCHSGDNNVTLDHISFSEVASRGITSMDMMAITYCEENRIPVVVFNLLEPGNISKALCGDQVGTLIDQAGRIS